MTARSTPKKQATNKWARAGIIAGSLVVLLLVAVFVARWLVDPRRRSRPGWKPTPGTRNCPAGAPVGFPAWLGWQHFLNVFFLVLIVRTGWQVRTTTRPAAHWVRNNKGLIRTKGAPDAHQPGPLVPPDPGRPVGAQRHHLHHRALCHRAMDADRAHQLGRLPQRPLRRRCSTSR